jgi:hypothetical protein
MAHLLYINDRHHDSQDILHILSSTGRGRSAGLGEPRWRFGKSYGNAEKEEESNDLVTMLAVAGLWRQEICYLPERPFLTGGRSV